MNNNNKKKHTHTQSVVTYYCLLINSICRTVAWKQKHIFIRYCLILFNLMLITNSLNHSSKLLLRTSWVTSGCTQVLTTGQLASSDQPHHAYHPPQSSVVPADSVVAPGGKPACQPVSWSTPVVLLLRTYAHVYLYIACHTTSAGSVCLRQKIKVNIIHNTILQHINTPD